MDVPMAGIDASARSVGRDQGFAADALVRPLPEALLAALPVTPREADVLACIIAGKTNVETAQELSISVRTVVKHLEHLYPKLGVSNRSAAAAFAHQRVAGIATRETTSRRLQQRISVALLVTPREADVLVCLVAGMTNRELARELSISVGTVVKHLEHLYRKLGVSTRSAAWARAVEALGGEQ